ncbi:unnamed protein product [Blepharisma stoltei]|uniref:Homologous-pairing protein 2 winged helix domain-containing protein n=1 Tax=Blepharisma stoltei TaxID=1481888 RepID=A0AAU9IMQ9_9CILI|nr:unnamed protein product [Blepharisma stoltei]
MGEKRKKVKTENEESKEKVKSPPKIELTDEEAAVLDYMVRQNRPYSALNVTDNLRGAVKKTNCAKVLDRLTELKKIQAKDFGKARIYLVNQESLPQASEDEIAAMDHEIAEKTEEMNKLKEETKDIQIQIKELDEELSMEEIEKALSELNREVEELQNEVQMLKDAGCVTEEESKALEIRRKNILPEESKRKRMFNEFLRGIADMMDVSLKELKNKIEIDEP